MGIAPLLLRPAPLSGLSLLTRPTEERSASEAPFSEVRFEPRYPVRSPLEDVLRLVPPGSDEYVTEAHAFAIERVLDRWAQSFATGNLHELRTSLDADIDATPLIAIKEVRLREGSGIDCVRREFSTALMRGSDRFLKSLGEWVGPDTSVESTTFEITSLKVLDDASLTVRTEVHFSIVASDKKDEREHRTGVWDMEWTLTDVKDATAHWKVRRLRSEIETRASARGPVFVDMTREALGGNSSYDAQMQHGSDYWRSVLDGACGIDVYGNNGVAAGDYDNDGFDDLYVCQPAGLPNRLYRNRGDGTFEDTTERAGVGVLDNTACALFADFRNCGLQDLLVVCGSGPLLFMNQGDGTFLRKVDAFRFASAPLGTFTHAAIADYDRDGRLDIYFCLYSYYLGLDQYHYPAPYFDARNGPPNFLLHNEGDGTFADHTKAAGLNVENDRYSFACAWSESSSCNMPNLYVVNDFGRNNLYLSNGDGTFRASSTKSHVEDVGAGMSACWTDYNNDQRQDLYVANMWSAAGQRVSEQKHFHKSTAEPIRELYRQHARGNALYRNEGDGSFSNVSVGAGVAMGGWAWCSDAWDFDHDGYSDLYVANGYISAPASVSFAGRQDVTNSDQTPQSDLGSFFWRQIVAKSPEDATPSSVYERGWNALNELIRSDRSWSGHERNVLLANNRDGTFSSVSGAVRLDFLEDSRSFALADLNHDGRLELVLKSRNAPQLRIVHNHMRDIGDSISFRLRGTASNRDAIGSVVTVTVGERQQTKDLQTGSGFLAQHSKELFFGLGKKSGKIKARVRWPSGLVQHFDSLSPNSRVQLVEGEEEAIAKPFETILQTDSVAKSGTSSIDQAPASSIETWLVDPLRAPDFALPDVDGTVQRLEAMRGRIVLLYFWSVGLQLCRSQIEAFNQKAQSLGDSGVSIVAINLDSGDNIVSARAFVKERRRVFPILFADDETAGIYNIIYRYLFDRRRNLSIPSSFLLDREGFISKIYQGVLELAHVLEDTQSPRPTVAERVQKALPFSGTLYHGGFSRNSFNYGVAMFQHGYLNEAGKSFEQVIAARPDDAEGYYNLGTLNLQRKDFAQARTYLQKTLILRPNYPEAWNNLGMMAAQEGHLDDAIENFNRSLSLRSNYAIALLNLGNVYRRQRNFAKAEDALTRVTNLQPDDSEANYSLGMLYAQQNQLQQAATYLQKAIELRPDYPEALTNLGILLIRENKTTEAEEKLNTCIRVAPNFDDSYINLARLYALQGENQKAREVLSDLLRRHPDNLVAKQGLLTLSTMP